MVERTYADSIARAQCAPGDAEATASRARSPPAPSHIQTATVGRRRQPVRERCHYHTAEDAAQRSTRQDADPQRTSTQRHRERARDDDEGGQLAGERLGTGAGRLRRSEIWAQDFVVIKYGTSSIVPFDVKNPGTKADLEYSANSTNSSTLCGRRHLPGTIQTDTGSHAHHR